MGVGIPGYLSLESVLYFLQENLYEIVRLSDGRVKRAFIELKDSLEEYKKQEEEQRERDLLAKLKKKYEQ